MSKRNRIIILLGIVFIVLLLVILIVWLMSRPQPQPPAPPADPSAINIPVILPQSSAVKTSPSVPPSEESLAANLKSIAASFAERFGSYSNEGNFNNLNDLRSMMTLKMNAWADNYIASQQLSENDSYYGVTAIAVSSKVITLSEELGQADIIVSTQRQTAKGSTINPRVSYQDLEIALVNTNDGWKVDSAQWQ